MLKAVITLITGLVYSIVLGLICVIVVDSLFPTITQVCPIDPENALYVVYGYLDYICWLILFIPLECAGLAYIYTAVRSIMQERQEFLLYQ